MAQAAHRTMDTEKDLWIAGHVFGDVDAENVTVAHDAVVDGNIGAERVTIYGRVNGIVRAPDILLGQSAVVEGQLCYETMTVSPGATIGAKYVTT